MVATQTSFVPQNILQNLSSLNHVSADSLPFGVVKLDDQGKIELYNKYNVQEYADFKGITVLGKNYFTEVAPCANNFLFSGRFQRGVSQNQLDMQFEYMFTYKIAPTKVHVHLYRDPITKTNWVFTKKI